MVQQALAGASASTATPVAGLSAADGVIADGHRPTPFDDVPAVAHLEPRLLDALRRAAKDASADGIRMRVNSGWRSPAYQERLLTDAVQKYRSREEAERWVATPETSEHVSGEAVDIGPWQAAEWLSEQGTAYGLCQVYDNEAWHFELRPEAVTSGCPPMYRDASQRER